MDLVEELDFEIVWRDSECNTKQTSGRLVELYADEHVDVIIGPPCSQACLSAGQLASFWNLPIISWVATDPEFNDKTRYTTLGRSLGPFTKLGTFLTEIMERYNWNRVVVIASTYLLFKDAANAIVKTFQENNVTMAYYATYDNNPTQKFIQNILTKTKREGRIVVICAPKRDRRMLLLEAYDMGMTTGEYVFYTVEMLPEQDVITAEETFLGDDGRDEDARKAFGAVFHVTLSGEEVDQFTIDVVRRLKDPPWNITLDTSIKGNKYSAFLHDAMILYALALNDTVSNGFDYRDGEVMLRAMAGKFFKGITGNVLMDMDGDREPDYWISDLKENGRFEKIAEVVNIDNATRMFRQIGEPQWGDGRVGHEFAPPDIPVCGFEGEFCQESSNVYIYVIAFSAVVLLVVLMVVLGFYLYRRSQYEAELMSMRWKIQFEDIQMISNTSHPKLITGHGSQTSAKSGSLGSGSLLSKLSSKCSSGLQSATTAKSTQYFCKVGVYRGLTVAMKKINKEHMQITRKVLIEFSEIRELSHDNLNIFIGASVDVGNIYVLWQYCPKGSLQDLLENDDVKLDTAFKMSFISDIDLGMEYLHKSQHGYCSHGNLKSSNCLVDNRWVVKISDYGLPSFMQGQSQSDETEEQDKFLRKLWTAPEILRMNFPPPCGTQKGDIYSFAIVLFEIIERSAPYTFDHITPRDVVNRIRSGESTPYRPVMSAENDSMGERIRQLMIQCWSENQEERPSFSKIKSVIRSINGGKNVSIMDNILSMMEKYSNNLEAIVEERTEQLVEEKRKTDRLLYRMLPPTVADALKLGNIVPPQSYECATIYFSDVVGFTKLSSESTPKQVVDLLNDLYTCFDGLISNHDVYKVETIGDAYMIVSGLPQRNGKRHSAEIANCALDLLSSITRFKIRHRPDEKLQLRIGIHTGPVVAGVVGLVMPRYCLFGDTVNLASILESNGKPLHVHISKQTYLALVALDCGYRMYLRGEMHIKGRGLLPTYFLTGKDGYKGTLPQREDIKKSDDMRQNDNFAEYGGDYEASSMHKYN
ncbi:atrial natriuretic peptide receptor 1-like [Saccoglossus kowalevskii]